MSKKARGLIEKGEHELFFSSGSLWEIVIKRNLGRDDFKVNARILRRGLLDNGYSELPIASEHVVAIDSLLSHHKDRFDRVLVAQAIVGGDHAPDFRSNRCKIWWIDLARVALYLRG